MSTSLRPNLQLIYVRDIELSTKFYRGLFQVEPVFVSPHYVAFSAGGAGSDNLFALWSRGNQPDLAVPRYGEIGIMVPSNADVDQAFETLKGLEGVSVIQEPFTEVFGRTFLLADPDGHLIRVSPID